MVAMLSDDQQATAQARMAYRSNASQRQRPLRRLTPDLQASPGVVFERAAYLRRAGMDTLALPMVVKFPAPPTERRGDRHLEGAQATGGLGPEGRRQPGAYAAANNAA
jgi:soluble lytic murein transglycosylase